MERVRVVENELTSAVHSFSTGAHTLHMSRPSRVRFDAGNPRNGRHRHSVFEPCLCTAGSGIFESDGAVYGISAGQAFLGVPQTAHEIRVEPGGRMEVLFCVFTVSAVAGREKTEADRTAEGFLENCRPVGDGSALMGYDAALRAHAGREGPGSELLMQAFLMDLLQALSLPAEKRSDREEALALLRSVPPSELTAARLAKELSMSERALYYFFAREFGTSPLDYIHRSRLSAGLGYLRMGLSVRDTAEMLGFGETSSFCRLFRQYYGITPTEYRGGFFPPERSATPAESPGGAGR